MPTACARPSQAQLEEHEAGEETAAVGEGAKEIVVTDEDEPEECRICGHHWGVGVCPYAGNEAMTAEDEKEILALLNAEPIATWKIAGPWSVNTFHISGWIVAVFFDGVGVLDWDYIEYVVTPLGQRYDAWPDRGESALPSSVANWSPQWPLSMRLRGIFKL